jgi:predicted DNA-binding protein (MmcQ/YjbR family)
LETIGKQPVRGAVESLGARHHGDRMDIDAIRQYCLGFPHTTENVQWGYDLCLKLDGKLFAVMPLEVAPAALSFKCSPENFVELCERPGIKPAAYMARAQWVSLEKLNTLPDSELRDLIAESYRLVWERLPKSRRAVLESEKTSAGKSKAAKSSRVKSKTASKTVKKKTARAKAKKSKPKTAKAGRRG